MTRQGLLGAIDELNVWKSGGARAPHKPLLLLLVLGRVRRGQPRLASYAEDVRKPLSELLRDFGPPHKALHPEYPFWHLHSETGGLWELAGHAPVSVSSGGSANSGDLIKHRVEGGLSEPVYRLLRRDPELLRAVADRLLYGHFPESMHDAIRDRVGLPLDSMVRGSVAREGESAVRAPRDPDFRHAVLRAYGRRGTVCDFDLRIADDLFGVEAAHIKWHAAGGPDRVQNGLALCTFHHKALDWGVIGLQQESDAYRLLVSNELSGQSPAFRDVLALRGKSLRPPQEEKLQPAAQYVDWHRREVFRGEPLSGRRR